MWQGKSGWIVIIKKKGRNMTEKLTAKNLKIQLWEALQSRAGDMNVCDIDSVTVHTREIMGIINTQLRILKRAKVPVTGDLVEFAKG